MSAGEVDGNLAHAAIAGSRGPRRLRQSTEDLFALLPGGITDGQLELVPHPPLDEP